MTKKNKEMKRWEKKDGQGIHYGGDTGVASPSHSVALFAFSASNLTAPLSNGQLTVKTMTRGAP
jgi:hypothetical protein